MNRSWKWSALALFVAPASFQGPRTVSVTVNEGTSMAVAVAPGGRTLAIDLQGGIWTLPATGGTAKRVTDEYNDARQPAWSPDGKSIAFQGFRDGGYDIWAVAPDGTGQRQLTWGPYDDREPAWSHDGTKLAFSSDRGDAGNYNIWVLDVASGAITRVTTDRSDEYMPTWGPGDRELAYIATRSGGQGVYATSLTSANEHQVATAAARADAPSWSPGGALVYHSLSGTSSHLELEGKSISGDENVFAFRVSWVSPTEFYYVSDGKIRKRSTTGGDAQTVEFSATFTVTPARYAKSLRDFNSTAPRAVKGIVRPAISPDGKQVAFAALGDIYALPVGASGGKPQNLTNDRYFDTDPAWSPDGAQLAWASDRGGHLNQIWLRDIKSAAVRQLTSITTSALGPSWSPDGTRIAFLDVDGIWGRATPSVVDVATGMVTKLHAPIFAPGNPTWSADGKRIAMAVLAPYSARFREGTNQVLTFSSSAGDAQSADVWFTPVKHLSIDSRVGAGPSWSPDGTRMALIYEGLLTLMTVGVDGAPLGPPRRLTSEMAHSPSWTADGRQILYQSMDKLRLLDVERGATRDVPLDLRYRPAIPTGQTVVHAGQLVDGKSDKLRADMDIVVVGNRIKSVAPHTAAAHASAKVVDATGLTVMPGLIEYHSHLQKDFGSAAGRAYLAFGITTVRSPGGSPYEAVEYRETAEAGVRPSPRIYSTGYLMEWNRVYYNMAVAVSSNAHLELELQRAKVLQHDLIKSYVRMPDIQQKRIIEFAHAAGIPVSSHEVFPSTLSGIDATEHVGATSRRGYSPKQATLQKTYSDVIKLFAAAEMPLTPTFALGSGALRRLGEMDPTFRTDARFGIYPEWLATQAGSAAGGRGEPNNAYQFAMGLMRAGTTVLAGTDTPNAANLHGELLTFVTAGMTPFQALQSATVNSARMLGLEAGSIEAGKLADLIVVSGNPLADISATKNVKQVMANGRVWAVADLIKSP